MISSFITHLIDRRYPSRFSLAKAKENSGLRLKHEGDMKAATVDECILKIERELIALETKLFDSSEQYIQLVNLENSWKRLMIESAQTRPKRKRKIEAEENKSQEVDTAADKKLQEVGVMDIVSEELSNRERDRSNQLQLILAGNMKFQTEFLNSSKEFAERIEEKLRQIHKNTQMRKNHDVPSSIQAGQHSKKSEEENHLAKQYPVGAKMFASLNKDKRIPSRLGKYEQGMSTAILEIPGSRRSRNTEGLGSEIHRASSRHYTDPITFQPASSRHGRGPIDPQSKQYPNASSTTTSSRADDFETTFGSIFFVYNSLDFKCYFVIDFRKECSTSYGSYGVVICPENEQIAYKLIFCQDSAERHVSVSINDQSNDSSRYMRTSSYRDIVYESEANKILAENDKLKKLCILVDGSEFPSFHSVAMLKMPRFYGDQVKTWLNLNFDQVHQVFEIVKSFHEEGFLHGDLHLGNFMMSNNGEDIRVMDFERIFKCKKATNTNDKRFNAVLKAIDTLALFRNNFFLVRNFTSANFQHLRTIFCVMKDYIQTLLPISEAYVADRRTQQGPHIDIAILDFFRWEFPNQQSDYANLGELYLKRLNLKVNSIFEGNVIWWDNASVRSQNMLQFIQHWKFSYLRV